MDISVYIIEISLTNEQTAIAVYDRGTARFEAVTVAVLAVKNGGKDLKEARAKLGRILQQHHLHISREQLAILLESMEQIWRSRSR